MGKTSLKATPGKIVRRNDSIQTIHSETPHRRRRKTAGCSPSVTSQGKSKNSMTKRRQAVKIKRRKPVKLITSKNIGNTSKNSSRIRIKRYRPSCRTATGLQQVDLKLISLKTELNFLKEVLSEMGEKLVSLETKIRTMIPVPASMNSPALPPPPPPPMPASTYEVTNNNFPICRVKGTAVPQPELRWPSITTEDLKKVKLRKTGLL